MTTYKKTKDMLDKISPSMCLAKWQQVGIHLHNGQTHSCHHPNTHTIPLEELKQNPSALHNTEYKKQQRKMMLEGKRPPECEYCWRVEDAPGNNYSDRVLKSAQGWANKYYDKVLKDGYTANTSPTAVELLVGNTCNFRCLYCGPALSSTWRAYIKQYGDVQLESTRWDNNSKMPIPKSQHNPYVEALWKWLPQIYGGLHVLKITGGEPTMMKETYDILSLVHKFRNTRLGLHVNSNLCPPDDLFRKFLEHICEITDKNVNKLIINASCDTIAPYVEYTRKGINFETYKKNAELILKYSKNAELNIMSTFNIMTIPGFDKFIDWIHDMNYKYSHGDHLRVRLDTETVINPKCMSVMILPEKYKMEIKRLHDYALGKICMDSQGYKSFESIQNLVNSIDNQEELKMYQRDFAKFIWRNDQSQQQTFEDIFPDDLVEFYKYCSELE